MRLKSPSWALFSFPSCFLFIRLVAPGERPCALRSSHSQPPDAVSEAQPGEPGGLHCVCPKWPSWEDSSACPEKRGLGAPLAGLRPAIFLATNGLRDFQDLPVVVSLEAVFGPIDGPHLSTCTPPSLFFCTCPVGSSVSKLWPLPACSVQFNLSGPRPKA